MADGPVTDEMLMALADGVLEEPKAGRVAAHVAADPALARRLAQLRAGGEAARRAFGAVAEEPVPDRLLAAVLAADAAAAPKPPAPANAPLWRRPPVAAAILSLAVALGAVAGRLTAPDAGSLAVPTPLLAAALSGAASGETLTTGAEAATILGTHRLEDGALCRAFATSGSDAASGIACRAGGTWRITALVRREGGGGFRPASGLDPALEAVLDRRGAGAPLGAAEEAALRARGW
jgi:hypothetical protein